MARQKKVKLSGLAEGDKVVMVNCLEAETHKDKVWVTKSEPWILSGHTEVIMLEGYRGCFATEMLQKVFGICLHCGEVLTTIAYGDYCKDCDNALNDETVFEVADQMRLNILADMHNGEHHGKS
jgi:hypothetical protein